MAKNLKDALKPIMDDIKKNIQRTLADVADDVKAEIDKALHEYYDEYPVPGADMWYRRTNQLLESCKIGDIKRTNGGGLSISVYLDIDSLHYTTPGADPYKTVVAANAGLHGGYDPTTKNVVPWNAISNDTGHAFGGGTQIWDDPLEKLFGDGKLEKIFLDKARKRGLNIH